MYWTETCQAKIKIHQSGKTVPYKMMLSLRTKRFRQYAISSPTEQFAILRQVCDTNYLHLSDTMRKKCDILHLRHV